NDDNGWQISSARTAAVRWRDQPQRFAVKTLLASASGAAEGCTEHSVDHDRRCRLRSAKHLRGRHPDACHGPYRKDGAALHEYEFYGAVLAEPSSAHHGPQAPLRGIRRGLRAGYRLPRL